ncbi:MAG: transporter substrate-binding domain-containing protein [Leptospiraceae bacterium]|nr:transporter substrate-binding domain-containing protein [Leptospiraceae bacterium]
MKSTIQKHLVLTLIISLFFSAGNLFSQTYKVGISGSSPFNMNSELGIEGVSVDVWKTLASRANIKYKLIDYDHINDLIDAVNRKEVDFGIGSISITSARIEKVAFTHPYYTSIKAILVRKDDFSLWKFVSPFLNKAFFYGIFGLIFVLFLVGNFILLTEKKVNPLLQGPYLKSIGNAMWLSIVTFTTVGYGDLTPKTKMGRIVIAIWMVISMITASSLTAGIATSFTLSSLAHSSINSYDSLKGRRVTAIKGSTGAEIIKSYGGKFIPAEDIEEALKIISEKKADALVSDYPILQYNITKSPIEDTEIIKISEDKDHFGFCTPLQSPFLQKFNKILLEMEEENKIQIIASEWGI